MFKLGPLLFSPQALFQFGPCWKAFIRNSFSELIAAELLDFIHVRIEDAKDAVAAEGALGEFLEVHLQMKEAKGLDAVSKYLPKELKIKHAIAVFDFVVKKMRDRN